jgi:hypothetical protein
MRNLRLGDCTHVSEGKRLAIPVNPLRDCGTQRMLHQAGNHGWPAEGRPSASPLQGNHQRRREAHHAAMHQRANKNPAFEERPSAGGCKPLRFSMVNPP